MVVKLTQEPLKLLDGEHRVVLRAMVEVVRHLGHVPRHGAAQRDPDRFTGRRADRGRPQYAGDSQQRHGETWGEHDGDNRREQKSPLQSFTETLRVKIDRFPEFEE